MVMKYMKQLFGAYEEETFAEKRKPTEEDF